MAGRVAQHKTLYEKNQAALNHITSMKEATAATAQLDQAKRMIDEDERELAAIGQRLQEANHAVSDRERVTTELAEAQEQARSSLTADQKKIERDLTVGARASRGQGAESPARPALAV